MNDRVYIRRTGDYVVLGNTLLELEFDLRANAALVGVRDLASGCRLMREAAAPKTLFRLAMRPARAAEGRQATSLLRPRSPFLPIDPMDVGTHVQDDALLWLDSREAHRCTWSEETAGDRTTLTFELSDFPACAALVRVHITLQTGSPLSTWRVEARPPADASVFTITCPVVSGLFTVGKPLPGECVAIPRRGEGLLFRDPYPVEDHLPLMAGEGPDSPWVGLGEVHHLYPGAMSMQLALYYHDLAGLYLASHDAGEHVKSFDLGQMADWGPFPVLSISHYPGEHPGAEVGTDYDTVVGVFHGDWYAGADIYKAWATRQWWCEKKLAERDIPGWLRDGFGIFQVSNYHIPVIKQNHSLGQIARLINQLGRETSVPMLGLVFNYEGGGAWTGPVGLFPPKEGEEAFRGAMEALRTAGNYGFVYVPGGQWYIASSEYEPPFDSWREFEAEGRPNAILNASGEVEIYHWYPGWSHVRLCPEPEFLGRMTTTMVNDCLARGCAAVQVDNFPCLSVEACYNPAHGHPLGFGPWWSQAYRRLLAETRRQAKAFPSNILSAEGIAENFIPNFELYDQRSGEMEYFGVWAQGLPMGGEAIPIFNYVYNEYIGSYLACFPECNRPEILYWTRCLGKSMVQGVIPMGAWYHPEPAQLNPVTIGFFRKVARASARECWKYLLFGEMLHPLKLELPRIRAAYMRMSIDLDHMDPRKRHVVEDAAVEHSSWRAPDGDLGYLFVNVSEETVEFDAPIGSNVASQGAVDVSEVRDGRRVPLHRDTRLPFVQPIRLEPLSTLLLEVHVSPTPE